MTESIGLDVGGTFTDLGGVRDDGTVRTGKVLSTPSDQSEGVERSLREAGADAASVTRIVHGTTVVPWTMRVTDAVSAPASRSDRSTPSLWSDGVLSTLPVRTVPSSRTPTRSVKVPPTSIPMDSVTPWEPAPDVSAPARSTTPSVLPAQQGQSPRSCPD